MENHVTLRQGLVSLSPLIVFLVLYLVLSLFAHDFYAVPIAVAFLIACMYSMCILPGHGMDERIGILTRGAASPNIMLMIWIFILAGAFAATAKEMGAVEATVNVALTFLPKELILAGLFIASCFISISIGTSVGTIATLTPIAAGMASQTGVSMPLLVAIVVGGAYFGDNLSFISDTTIMATRTQGCQMKDKFRMNIRIALPAALITLAIYILMGLRMQATPQIGGTDFMLVLPYLFVFVAAAAGMNVILVLVIGTLLAFAIGMWQHLMDIYSWMGAMNKGIMGMSELIIVTLMAGGLMEVIRYKGGIRFILERLTRRIRGTRGAECCIAALVTLTDFCTANNTIAILTVGPLAKDISQHYGVDPRRSASLLDTFSCFAQGIIPYGAQMLIASGLTQINPLQIIPHLYYPFLLGAVSFAFILIHPKYEKDNSSAAASGGNT